MKQNKGGRKKSIEGSRLNLAGQIFYEEQRIEKKNYCRGPLIVERVVN